MKVKPGKAAATQVDGSNGETRTCPNPNGQFLEVFQMLNEKFKCARHNNNPCYVEFGVNGEEVVHRGLAKNDLAAWTIAIVNLFSYSFIDNNFLILINANINDHLTVIYKPRGVKFSRPIPSRPKAFWDGKFLSRNVSGRDKIPLQDGTRHGTRSA